MSGYITFEERLEIESMIFQRCSFGESQRKLTKTVPLFQEKSEGILLLKKAVTVSLVLMLTAQELDRMHFKCSVALIKKL